MDDAAPTIPTPPAAISRAHIEATRAQLVQNREQIQANLNAILGAIQGLDMLLATAPAEPPPPVEPTA